MLLTFLGITCKSAVDVCFIIDSSDSIMSSNPPDCSYDNWNLLLQFVSSLSRTYYTGQNATRISAVAFAEEAEVIFPLDAYEHSQEVTETLLRMIHMNGSQNTAAGLHKASNECFNSEYGDRADIPNLAIIITHGMPSSKARREAALKEAVVLHEAGVTVIAIGITGAVDKTFLSQLSSPPQVFDRDYFFVKDFLELDEFRNRDIGPTCETPESKWPNI